MKFGPDMGVERVRVLPVEVAWPTNGNKPEVPDEDYGEAYWFWCAGCTTHHRFTTKYAKGEVACNEREGRKSPLWTFSGTLELPTFSPSLVYPDSDGKGTRCHLLLKAGIIEYLSDSTHQLAGQKVPVQRPT